MWQPVEHENKIWGNKVEISNGLNYKIISFENMFEYLLHYDFYVSSGKVKQAGLRSAAGKLNSIFVLKTISSTSF